MFVLMSFKTFSQQTEPPPQISKQGLLEKSKKQKTTAWILLAGGAGLELIGALWASSNFESSGPDVLFVTGALSMLGSIPLFIASSKNKKKAMGLSFKNERLPQLITNSHNNHSLPSLILKVSL